MPARFILSTGAPSDAPRTIDRTIELAGHLPTEIMRILRERIEQLDRETEGRFALEYCSVSSTIGRYGQEQPTIRPGYRWAIVYPVTGGSEGHYLHLVVIYQRDEKGQPLSANDYHEIGLIKIFGGWDAAAELAGRIGRWIDA